jgi:hypothetical protein
MFGLFSEIQCHIESTRSKMDAMINRDMTYQRMENEGRREWSRTEEPPEPFHKAQKYLPGRI